MSGTVEPVEQHRLDITGNAQASQVKTAPQLYLSPSASHAEDIMYEEMQSEYNARFDDHAERWASEKLDARRGMVTDPEEDKAIFDIGAWNAAQG